MDDENVSHVYDGKKTTSLLDLPEEMILHICSFLDTSTLHDLSLVCKGFNEILKKSTFIWKARINRIWPYTDYPLLQPANLDELFWKRSCVAIEKQTVSWRPNERSSPENLILITNPKYDAIDALLLMHDGTTCIASTKNRSLLYFKYPSPGKKPSGKKYTEYIEFAHNKSICDLTAIDNTIYSCSLDQSVKSWMFTNTGLFEQKTYELNTPGGLLCVSSCPERGLFATGSHNGTIFVFDSRQDKSIKQYPWHTGAVVKLAMNSEYILSASEDQTVSVWDQRAGRTMKSITISGDGVPTCMNMQRDWVCIGDSTAMLHLLDLKNDSGLVKSYFTGHTTRITGGYITDGYLITAAYADSTINFSSLTDPPQIIVQMHSPFRKISRMDYLNDIVAISDINIAMFCPKLTYSINTMKRIINEQGIIRRLEQRIFNLTHHSISPEPDIQMVPLITYPYEIYR